MNKTELIESIANEAEITNNAAGKALDAITNTITNLLKDGDSLTLVGFGTFSVKERSARTGRNPQTGEAIEIKASKNAHFKAGKKLKDALN
ncbi:HU family DNA-binding protein [Dasania marina]|uniref:HU family DNA-binding protein n=1 Tax=Dasania marina TaxID=471499 RepID=UPI0030D7834C|tara:strand:+ start:1969 stop:2241 length:273 start_codon:yes stop_codon:yes gene_type:complete